MDINHNFLQALEHRRSYYEIGNQSPVSQEEIVSIVRRAMECAPSAFNSQSSRVVTLFGESHHTLWDGTKEVLKQIVPADKFSATEEKINSFFNGYGTILYFEDEDVVAKLQTQYPLYAENFPIWSLQSSGMLQLAVWTALEDAGLGANLQHYNPLIDKMVHEKWNVPQNWKLLAQMPFGNVKKAPQPKDILPVEPRLKVFR